MPSIDLPVAESKPSLSNDPAMAIRFDDVAIAFDHPVLEGVSFSLRRGETKILMGVSDRKSVV